MKTTVLLFLRLSWLNGKPGTLFELLLSLNGEFDPIEFTASKVRSDI